MSLMNIFIGAPQSKYAAMAILSAIFVVSLTMLFGKEPIPLSQKFAFVLLIFLISLPGLLMTLFQLTCLVTGAGRNNSRWWCWAYAWIISILLIAYCVFLIAIAVVTLASGEKAMMDIARSDAEHFQEKMNDANQQAASLLRSAEEAPKKKDADAFKVQGGESVPASVDVAAPTGIPPAAVKIGTLPSAEPSQPTKNAVMAAAEKTEEAPQPFVDMNGFMGAFSPF